MNGFLPEQVARWRELHGIGPTGHPLHARRNPGEEPIDPQLAARELGRARRDEAERERMLDAFVLFREKPRTGSLGGGYLLVGSR